MNWERAKEEKKIIINGSKQNINAMTVERLQFFLLKCNSFDFAFLSDVIHAFQSKAKSWNEFKKTMPTTLPAT